jgi:hypothetical protein
VLKRADRIDSSSSPGVAADARYDEERLRLTGV